MFDDFFLREFDRLSATAQLLVPLNDFIVGGRPFDRAKAFGLAGATTFATSDITYPFASVFGIAHDAKIVGVELHLRRQTIIDRKFRGVEFDSVYKRHVMNTISFAGWGKASPTIPIVPLSWTLFNAPRSAPPSQDQRGRKDNYLDPSRNY